jgi:hypothetical protein
MEEIIAELQRIHKEPLPFNEMAMTSYYRNQLYDLREVIERLARHYEYVYSLLREQEGI